MCVGIGDAAARWNRRRRTQTLWGSAVGGLRPVQGFIHCIAAIIKELTRNFAVGQSAVHGGAVH
jgi:hypothetical protein